MFCVLLLTSFLALFIWIAYKFYSECLHFEKRGIKYKGHVFGIGNIVRLIFGRFTYAEFNDRLYNQFKDERIYGLTDGIRPQYIIRDPELVKLFGIKAFDNFEERLVFVNEKTDQLWGNSLFFLNGEKWRQMRATLSPAFTGSKMRQMFELVANCSDDVVKYLNKQVLTGKGLDYEMKDFFSRYTNDVIVSCAFGIKVDSMNDPDNMLYTEGKYLLNVFTGIGLAKIFLFSMMPKVCTFFKLQITNTGEFRRIVLDTMDLRKKNNIHRSDMINIMMQIREGSLKHQAEDKTNDDEGFATVEESEFGKATVNRIWNDDEIAAQCFIFFFAGFETTSTVLTWAAYELAVNPEIQQKLYEEIVRMNELLGDQPMNYDAIQKMKYLDQVVSEVMRKWPPLSQPHRICNKDYIFDDGDKLRFNIVKGSGIIIPAYNLQNDPQYFPDPKKFDPERFSDENKNNIVPGTYIPFGIGPRNCVGSRFALMAVKSILYNLLLKFSLEPNEKTIIPVKLAKNPHPVMENGWHLRFKSRT